MATKTKTKSDRLKKSFTLKPLDLALLSVAVLLIIFGIWSNLNKKEEATCKTAGSQHEIIVKEDAFSVPRLELNQCDTVQIANLGAETYELAFGYHDKHQDYPGFTMQTLRPNEYFVLDAVQAGTYRMHDHLRDKAVLILDIRAKQ